MIISRSFLKIWQFFLWFIMVAVGAKAEDHTMGLGPRMGRSTMFEEKTWVPKGLPAHFLWA